MTYENTHLWLTTLAVRPEGEGDPSSGPRERLRAAFLNFRERAQVLAAEIPRDMPEFTVHDISHIDALWEMADLVAGADYHLTPTEAFVLGGAFLIHDIGMSLAAYPRGIAALQDHDEWRDTLASHLHSELGRPPNGEEFEDPPTDVERVAVAEMLRNLHAQRAGELALTSWLDNEEVFHLSRAQNYVRNLDQLSDESPTAIGGQQTNSGTSFRLNLEHPRGFHRAGQSTH